MGSLEFREIPQPLNLRIQLARNSRKYDPNCYGTAFFLLGVLPYDLVIFTDKRKHRIKEAISKMFMSEYPRDNSLLISFDEINEPHHAAFIERATPLRGYHREGSQGPFKEFSRIEDIEKYLKRIPQFENTDFKHKFYTLKTKDIFSDWARERVDEYTFGWWA